MRVFSYSHCCNLSNIHTEKHPEKVRPLTECSTLLQLIDHMTWPHDQSFDAARRADIRAGDNSHHEIVLGRQLHRVCVLFSSPSTVENGTEGRPSIVSEI